MHFPSKPDTVVGRLDLTDASAGDSTAVHGVATGTDGSRYLEYTIRHPRADSTGVANATGYVTDGRRRMDFLLTASAALASHRRVSLLQLDDSAAGLHVVLSDSAQMGVDTFNEELDLTLDDAGTTLELAGSTGWFNTLRSWDDTVTLNQVPLARVAGSRVPEGGEPTITPLVARSLTVDERQLITAAMAAPTALGLDPSRVLGAGRGLVPITF
jgi:hypothetical protein